MKGMSITPPKFNSSPLKNGGWNTTFLLGFGKNTGKMDGEFPWRFVCVPKGTRFVKKVDSSFLQGHLLISISKLIRFY